MSISHQEFLELLPWYVNGTLDDGESEALKAHLGECLPCNVALREELGLRTMLKDQGSLPVGQDRGLNDLLQRIEKGHGSGRRRFVSGMPGYALAGAACVIVTTGALGVWRLSDDSPADDAAFSTLFSESDSGGNRVDVIFVEPPGAGELEQFLIRFGGRVTEGPTSLGRYTIEFEAGRSQDELLDRLGADPLVQFAGQSFTGSAADGADGQDAQ